MTSNADFIDFDVLQIMKTPFFMGDTAKVPIEAHQCDINEEDQANLTQKNLLLIRALTAMNEVDSLKTLIQGLMAGETPQKQNVQGFSILIQFFLSNVSSTTRN